MEYVLARSRTRNKPSRRSTNRTQSYKEM